MPEPQIFAIMMTFHELETWLEGLESRFIHHVSWKNSESDSFDSVVSLRPDDIRMFVYRMKHIYVSFYKHRNAVIISRSKDGLTIIYLNIVLDE